MKRILATLTLLAALALPAAAQTGITPPPGWTAITNVQSLAQNIFALIPQADLSITNGPSSFQSGEMEFEVSTVFKSLGVVGASPYVSLGGGYFFTRNLGAMADLMMFNDGAGASTANSASFLLELRKPLGNLAGYLILGPHRDFNEGRFGARFGGGIEYRYNTGVGFMCDATYVDYFKKQDKNEMLVRLGLTAHF